MYQNQNSPDRRLPFEEVLPSKYPWSIQIVEI